MKKNQQQQQVVRKYSTKKKKSVVWTLSEVDRYLKGREIYCVTPVVKNKWSFIRRYVRTRTNLEIQAFENWYFSYTDESEWTQQEKQMFEKSYSYFDKNLVKVQCKVRTRSLKDVMNYALKTKGVVELHQVPEQRPQEGQRPQEERQRQGQRPQEQRQRPLQTQRPQEERQRQVQVPQDLECYEDYESDDSFVEIVKVLKAPPIQVSEDEKEDNDTCSDCDFVEILEVLDPIDFFVPLPEEEYSEQEIEELMDMLF